jgi:DNA-binding response OmpR family regulator
MRVLLADDDAVIRTLLGAVLVSLGHDPVLATDGEEAWRQFELSRPPLVVLDIEMPKLDGIELCRRVRAADVGREVFILVLTGRDSPDALAAVLDAGADDYVTKPASPENIRARLIIAERRIQQDIARRAAETELARSRWLAGIGETTIALQHEINNPLTALLGHAELLLMDYKDRNESNEQVEVIFDQARRIADVVKRLGKLKDPESVDYIAGAKMIDLSQPGNEQR